MPNQIELECGRLQFHIRRAEISLHELLDFASRANPKRGFLFVSKVLGKHLPCRPNKMRELYDRLSQSIGQSQAPTLVLGMAETAIGLGAGVADSLYKQGSKKVIFQQTTRHKLALETLITFDEIHSHAPDQLLYPPLDHLSEQYYRTERLVLVDDEITSGRTLKELALATTSRFSELSQRSSSPIKEVVFVSIVSWLSENQKQILRNLFPVNLRFETVLEGEFNFEPNPLFKPTLPGQVSAKHLAQAPRDDLGRRGLNMAMIHHIADHIDLASFDRQRPITVIGTGEFAFQPFLVAEYLSNEGFDVLYQSTTRSPILLGGAIKSSLTLSDEQAEGVTNYLHNPPNSTRQVIITYESAWCKRAHDLDLHLSADTWVHPEVNTEYI